LKFAANKRKRRKRERENDGRKKKRVYIRNFNEITYYIKK
jgi:hypothetical protein